MDCSIWTHTEEDAEAFAATWAIVAELPIATPEIARDLIAARTRAER